MPRKAFPSAGSGQAGVAESSCDLLPKAKRAQETEPVLFINPGNDLLSHTVASAVTWVLKGKNVSGKDQAAFGLRDGATEFFGGLNPLLDNGFDIPERLPACFPIRSTTWQFGHFGDERFVLRAPVDNDLVLRTQFPLPTCTLE